MTSTAGGTISPRNIYFDETVAATTLAASATFTGTTRDAGFAPGAQGHYTTFGGTFLSPQIGTARVEVSRDGTVFVVAATVAVSANTSVDLTVRVRKRFARVSFVNGTTALTAGQLDIVSSFTG